MGKLESAPPSTMVCPARLRSSTLAWPSLTSTKLYGSHASFQRTSCQANGMLIDIRTAHATGQFGAVRLLSTSMVRPAVSEVTKLRSQSRASLNSE